MFVCESATIYECAHTHTRTHSLRTYIPIGDSFNICIKCVGRITIYICIYIYIYTYIHIYRYIDHITIDITLEHTETPEILPARGQPRDHL